MCKPARSLDSGNCSLTWTSRGLQWWSACQSERWARSSRYHRSCTGRCRACHWTWGSAGDRWNWRGSWRRNGARLSRPSRCCETLTGCDRPPSDLQTTAGWKGKQEKRCCYTTPSNNIALLYRHKNATIHQNPELDSPTTGYTERVLHYVSVAINKPKTCILLLWNSKVVLEWEQLTKHCKWCLPQFIKTTQSVSKE